MKSAVYVQSVLSYLVIVLYDHLPLMVIFQSLLFIYNSIDAVISQMSLNFKVTCHFLPFSSHHFTREFRWPDKKGFTRLHSFTIKQIRGTCILIDRPFKCTECEWAFKRRCELDVHMMRHKRIYPFVCDLCGKGTCTSTELRAHKRIHTGEKPYGCKQCTQSKNKIYHFLDQG